MLRANLLNRLHEQREKSQTWQRRTSSANTFARRFERQCINFIRQKPTLKPGKPESHRAFFQLRAEASLGSRCFYAVDLGHSARDPLKLAALALCKTPIRRPLLWEVAP